MEEDGLNENKLVFQQDEASPYYAAFVKKFIDVNYKGHWDWTERIY